QLYLEVSAVGGLELPLRIAADDRLSYPRARRQQAVEPPERSGQERDGAREANKVLFQATARARPHGYRLAHDLHVLLRNTCSPCFAGELNDRACPPPPRSPSGR